MYPGSWKTEQIFFFSLSAIEASFHEGSGQSLHRVCEQFGGKISTPGFLIFSLPLPSFLLREGTAQSQVSQFQAFPITRLRFLEALFPFLSQIFSSLQDLEGPSRTWEDLYCQEIPLGVSNLTFSIKLTDNTLESKLNSLCFEVLSLLPSVVLRSNPHGLTCLSISVSF